MSLILPASSSPDLKAFPLHLRHCRSFVSLQVFQIFRGRAGRDCVFHFVPATDSPDTRFSVKAEVVLSGCLCLSRKDPYLPLEPQCVRLLPRPTGLPPMAFVASFRLCFADAKTVPKHHRSTHIRPLPPHHFPTVISRPKGIPWVYIFFRDGPYQVLLCYLCA